MKFLQKYWTVIKLTWINGFAYPVSFWMWRLRQVIQVVIALSIWESIYISNDNLSAFGYDKDRMLTYIFLANIINFIVFDSRTIDVGNIIHSGDLSLYLVKPLNFFSYWFSRDLADKFQNIVFSVTELSFLYFVFHPHLYFPHSFSMVLLTLCTAILALFMYFFINLIFGFLGFWSPDIWAPRFLFFMITSFVAGTFFPLDIFPKSIVDILFYTPFPYLIYFPTKIWLEQLSSSTISHGILVASTWTILCGAGAYAIWKKGLKDYSSEGR